MKFFYAICVVENLEGSPGEPGGAGLGDGAGDELEPVHKDKE